MSPRNPPVRVGSGRREGRGWVWTSPEVPVDSSEDWRFRWTEGCVCGPPDPTGHTASGCGTTRPAAVSRPSPAGVTRSSSPSRVPPVARRPCVTRTLYGTESSHRSSDPGGKQHPHRCRGVGRPLRRPCLRSGPVVSLPVQPPGVGTPSGGPTTPGCVVGRGAETTCSTCGRPPGLDVPVSCVGTDSGPPTTGPGLTATVERRRPPSPFTGCQSRGPVSATVGPSPSPPSRAPVREPWVRRGRDVSLDRRAPGVYRLHMRRCPPPCPGPRTRAHRHWREDGDVGRRVPGQRDLGPPDA